MKIYNIAIPVLFAFLLMNTPTSIPTSDNDGSEITTLEKVEVVEIVQDPIGPKKGGIVTGEQDFSNCNICADCTDCPNSEGGCIGATITIIGPLCPYESTQGTLAFPGNSQYICSLVQTGPYTFYVEFNAVAYSCSLPDTPFQFTIPMTYTYACSGDGGGVLGGSLHFIIC